jgi:hypothetical protein
MAQMGAGVGTRVYFDSLPHMWLVSLWILLPGNVKSSSFFRWSSASLNVHSRTLHQLQVPPPMNKGYEIPTIQGESSLQVAISLMLRRYLESDGTFAHKDPAIARGLVALRFAWWLFDHPEELEAVQVEVERNRNGGVPT